MTRSNHIKRHQELHKALDELLADFIRHNPGRALITKITLMEFLEWSHQQTIEPSLNPDDPENTPEDDGTEL